MEERLELKKRAVRRLPEMISAAEEEEGLEHTVEEEAAVVVIAMDQEEVDMIGIVVMKMELVVDQEGVTVVLVAVMVREEMREEVVEMIATVVETMMIGTMTGAEVVVVEVEVEPEAVLAAQDTGPEGMIVDMAIVAVVLLLGAAAREGTATEMTAGERVAAGPTVIKCHSSEPFRTVYLRSSVVDPAKTVEDWICAGF